MTPAKEKVAVLLLAHGSPDKPEDVPEFLQAVTSGRPLPEAAVQEIAHRYGLIGASPLTRLTLRQGELLSQELGLPVYVGMRNWKPWINGEAGVRAQMQRDGITRAVVICLAPQNSRTSVGLYRKALLGESGAPFAVDFIESWHDEPQLIAAFAERLSAALAKAKSDHGAAPPVLFTAHSVPERTLLPQGGLAGDPYADQAKHTAELVARAAGLMDGTWWFAFQSQGMSGGPWLGPTVEDTILGLKELGNDAVLMQPIGFVCDHVEVLYDIDIAFRQFAKQHGMELWRADSLNDSPRFIRALAEVAKTKLSQPVPAK
ncbi:MAG: ferrochelatase [Candidatus Koribacter versatilis]|uniref:Ferrochelatase n=1 Tax=Candidatus Korobacter versatilis TaxID=658062 RepID=A0A932EQB0_9BACT|nr:ferrochelatase [Candidatus Koribacter versatilis]